MEGCGSDDAHIVEDDAHEDVEWDPEEVHDCAPRLLGDVLRPHLHDRRPEQADAGLEDAEAEELDGARQGDAPSPDRRGRHEELPYEKASSVISHSIGPHEKEKPSPAQSMEAEVGGRRVRW